METAFSNIDMPAFSMEVNQALLKEDDDLLRQIFSQVFRHHHPEVANKVDVIFSLAQVCDELFYLFCVYILMDCDWLCVGLVPERIRKGL